VPNNIKIIILNIRAPRIILAVVIGAGLSAVGAAFQALFKNPMADPYILGISSGASLGAAVGIIALGGVTVFGFGVVSVFAFVGSMATTALVYVISVKNGRLNTMLLLLSGVAVSFLLNSVITILLVFNRKTIEMVVMWMMGSVSAAGWKQVYIAAPIIILGSALIYFFAKELNIMSLGDETSKSLGVETERVKIILLALCALIVGACVSVGGIIGFVGLIIPHITRLLFGADNRVVIPMSTVIGAIFLVFSDTAARNIMPLFANSPSELPVGAITALFGAPFFIYLLLRTKGRSA